MTNEPHYPAGARDPLTAIPVIADGIVATKAAAARMLLSWQAPPRTAVGRWLARQCGWARSGRIELDEYGAAFWRQIDGRRSLRDIAAHLRGIYPFAPGASEAAVIAFTKQLMLRGVLCLRLPDLENPTRTP